MIDLFVAIALARAADVANSDGVSQPSFEWGRLLL